MRAKFLLLAALWGSSFLFMRLGAAEFGPWATAGVRVAVASAFLSPLLWWHGRWPDLRRHIRPILFVGLLYGALLLGETVTLQMLLGGCVVLCGVALALGLVGTRSTTATLPR